MVSDPQTPTRRRGESPEEQYARAHRRIWTGVITVCILVLIGLGFLGYRQFSVRFEGVEQAEQAQTLIDQADAIVVEVDTVVASEVTTDLAQTAQAAKNRVPKAVDMLKMALKQLEVAKATSVSQDFDRLDLLRDAAQSRLHMLSHAPALLALNIKAANALAPARGGWDLLLAADKKSDEAVAEYNKLTKAGVSASRALNKQAAKDLASAQAEFEKAEEAFPEAPFEQYVAYVKARIALNKLSQKSDAAWLSNKLSSANSASKEYNAADQRAVELAKALPASPDAAIAAAYEAASKAPTDEYYQAREEATKADKELREQ